MHFNSKMNIQNRKILQIYYKFLSTVEDYYSISKL
jgi:hypothetical protein